MIGISSNYGGALCPNPMLARLEQNLARDIPVAHHIWRWGDHGGGLPRINLALLDRFRNRSIMPTFVFSSAAGYARDAASYRDRMPVQTDFTIHLHEGTYTTHARTKAQNRHGEAVLLDAEAVSALAGLDAHDELAAAWEPLLFNQFHDILCGASVAEAYEEADRRAAESLACAERIRDRALERLVGDERIAVANQLGVRRSELVTLPAPVEAGSELVDESGRRHPIWSSRGASCTVISDLEPFEVRRFSYVPSGPGHAPPSLAVVEDDDFVTVETPAYRARVSRASGVIASLYDRAVERELVGFGTPRPLSHTTVTRHDLALGVFQLLEEASNSMAAWQVAEIRRETSLLRADRVELVASGPDAAEIEVVHRFGASSIRETITFTAALRRIDFAVTVDWQEVGSAEAGVPHLKLAFAGSVSRPSLTSDGPYVIKRLPADGQQVALRNWADVTGDEMGFTVFNDSVYGMDCLGGRLRMSLVRTSYRPDPRSDQGELSFRFGLRVHGPQWRSADAVAEGESFLRRPLATGSRRDSARESGPMDERGAPRDVVRRLEGTGVVCTHLRRTEAGVEARLFEANGTGARVAGMAAFGPYEVRSVRI